MFMANHLYLMIKDIFKVLKNMGAKSATVYVLQNMNFCHNAPPGHKTGDSGMYMRIEFALNLVQLLKTAHSFMQTYFILICKQYSHKYHMC